MDAATAIGLVTTAIDVFTKVEPVLAQAITDLKPFAVALFEKFTGQNISDTDRADLEARIDDMHNQIQAPIPSDEDQ